jgi:hypothetical protein
MSSIRVIISDIAIVPLGTTCYHHQEYKRRNLPRNAIENKVIVSYTLTIRTDNQCAL